MRIKRVFITMLLCLAFSANACGTDGPVTDNGTGQETSTGDASDTDTDDDGPFDLTEGENGKPPVITLSSGYAMPVLGLGTYSLHGDECIDAILSAIKLGYRKFDTATFYGNEKEVGEAIRRSGLPREKFFICTKLYPNEFGHAKEAIEASLARLGIGYVDLTLLHVMTQNEIHPYYQEKEVRGYMHRNGIVIEGWYPFGGRGYTKAMFSNGTVKEIAEAHGKSPAQIILRWDLQHGVTVIPGSSNPAHQKENISVFDFELSPEEMARIGALDRDEKHDWY